MHSISTTTITRLAVAAASSASLCVGLAAPVAAQSTSPAAPATPVMVVKAGRLIDVAAGRVRENQAIVIEGGRIVAVGPLASTPVPAGANPAG